MIQNIQKHTGTLLAIVWFFVIAGCRDFQDHRTPYKSLVTIAFKPINKGDELPEIIIVKKPTDSTEEEEILKKFQKNNITYISLSLNPKIGFIQLDIHDHPAIASSKQLTIHYQKEVVLISPQCGCTYKYVLKEVKTTGAGKCKIINKELSTFNDSFIDVQIYL